MLTTLDEYNAERALFHKHKNIYPKPNGIACPKCNAEMDDIDGNILASIPPKKTIKCPKCRHIDYRLA